MYVIAHNCWLLMVTSATEFEVTVQPEQQLALTSLRLWPPMLGWMSHRLRRLQPSCDWPSGEWRLYWRWRPRHCSTGKRRGTCRRGCVGKARSLTQLTSHYLCFSSWRGRLKEQFSPELGQILLIILGIPNILKYCIWPQIPNTQILFQILSNIFFLEWSKVA